MSHQNGAEISISMLNIKACVISLLMITYPTYGIKHIYVQLIAMSLVEVVHHLPGSRHDLHRTRTVRVTTQCHRVILKRQINIFACD
jgi:hypothetical protein